MVADREDRVLMVHWTLGLLEEVGHELGPEGSGPCVAHRVHTFPFGEWDGQEEWYYLLRVGTFDAAAFLERLLTDGRPAEPLELEV